MDTHVAWVACEQAPGLEERSGGGDCGLSKPVNKLREVPLSQLCSSSDRK